MAYRAISRQARVAVAGEEVLAALPEREVHVHAAAVVAEQRLGHEGRPSCRACLADVLDDVLVLQHVVGHLHQRRRSACRSRTGRRWPPRGAAPRSAMPICSRVSIISLRMSCRVSVGRDGEVALLVAGSCSRGSGSRPGRCSSGPSTESMW